MHLTLYYHPLSSYCHKVLVALYEHGIDFDGRIIDLGNQADRAELAALWPFTKFPVLRDHTGERDVVESSIIIEYLDLHAGDHARLIPQDSDDALDVRLWDRIFDQYVMTPLQAIVGNTFRPTPDDMAAQFATLDTAYRLIDERMAARTWAAGMEFSLADCAAAPSLFYAVTVRPFPDDCPHLLAYYDRLMDRPSVQRVHEEAKPYFGMYPFADALAPRFR